MRITADDVAAVSAGLSAATATIALIVAIRSGKAANIQANATRDTATATRDAAQASQHAAQASHDAAAAAKDSARIANTLKAIEIARRHDELGPSPLFSWPPVGEDNGAWLIITPQGPLDYIITGERRWTRDGTPSHDDLPTVVARSRQPCGLHICNAYSETIPDQLLIRFDPAEGEPCPCNTPQTPGSGHWQFIIPGPPYSDE